MADVTKAKKSVVTAFRTKHTRALELFNTIAINGHTQGTVGQKPLPNHDARDAAQFIFFELAAAFEDLACSAFEIEVRTHFQVNPLRAVYIMGSVDRALSGVMGWALPNQLKSRGDNLFGKSHFFAKLDDQLGKTTYDHLSYAHVVRNRIAHSGGKAVADYRKLLGQLGVPAKSRKGAGVGRALLEYPTTAVADDKWFHRFAKAYLEFANKFAKKKPKVP